MEKFNDRQKDILVDIISYAISNVDDINEALNPEDENDRKREIMVEDLYKLMKDVIKKN